MSDHDRPVPIQDAFSSIPNTIRFLASIVATLAGFGVLTAVQGDAVVGLLGLIPGVAAAVAEVLREFRVTRAIHTVERVVTPLSDPARRVDGGALVALVAAVDHRPPRSH